MISLQRKRKVAAALLLLDMERRRKKKTTRRFWVDDFFLSRDENSFFHEIYAQLKTIDPTAPITSNGKDFFKNFTRMSFEDFNFLLALVAPKISKQDTRFRKAIPPRERLAVTLRYLATGESFSSLRYVARMADCTISHIVHETCAEIYSSLKDEYLKVPSSIEEWEKIAKVFEERWNFPNCIGALDGKHVTIQAPAKCGSEYFNYKLTNSIVLMAMADGEYKFTFVDVGAYGRDSDGGVFARCALSTALENQTLNLPPPKPLPNEEKPMPYVLVADDAFPIKTYLMKPYAFRKLNFTQRVFNYRLSRARRIIENVFGICASRFRILRKPIEVQPDRATKIVLAICALHNFLISRKSVYANATDFDREVDGQLVLGSWHDEVNNIQPNDGRVLGRPDLSATVVRDEFRKYFISENGEVDWQYKACGFAELPT